MMQTLDVESRILDFLAELKPELDFTASENLVDEGLLDSLDIILLVSLLEEEFGSPIRGDLIVPENFQSIEAIASLTARR